MATPVIATDGVDSVNAATQNKALSSNGKLNIKVLYARIRYNGTSWEVVSTTDSSQLVTGNLAWSTNKITLAISGYTAVPVVVASQHLVTTPYIIQFGAVSTGSVEGKFFDAAGSQVTTQGTSMDVNLMIIGV